MSLEAALADLEAKIGTETHVSTWLTITQVRINQFAAATDDHQWIHVDVARAESQSPFGSTIAHGYLTLALIPYLTGRVDPAAPRYEGVKMGINYGLNRARFPNPVQVGAKVRTRTSLVSAEAVANNGIQVVEQVTIEIEGVKKPGCVAETVARLYF